ncbi:MAG: hypothetical protein RLZZ436_1395 [Planctomycetota bacterium]|jgi:hypothetical protein
MPHFTPTFTALLLLALPIPQVAGQGTLPPETSSTQIDYNRDIRPILSNHCWNCHGRDEGSRQAELRLDEHEAGLSGGISGLPAVVPGKPANSELVRRIRHTDPDLVMPPPETQKPLSPRQMNLLEQWIASGAPRAEHWAFIPPVRPPVPNVSSHQQTGEPVQPIDAFIIQQLRKHDLNLSPPAPPATWLRRVSLDVTGLPPSPAEQQEFLSDVAARSLPEARERVVDRLLASPASAERLAMLWLDLARYADTNGYNNDETRTMWPWRDWVIEAFHSNMPYDQFLTEQLAGDLLPNASLSQKVATGFNRNHVLTTEGGIIEEEYHAEYVADRIHTTSTVFLALSIQCARCHDHKYDPISQQDFYQLAAFFNNVPDRIVSYSAGRMAEPLLKVPTAAQQAELERLTTLEADLQARLRRRVDTADEAIAAWEAALTPAELDQPAQPGLAAAFTLDEATGNYLEQLTANPAGVHQGPRKTLPGRFGQAAHFDGTAWIAAASAGDFEADQPFALSVWVRPESGDAATVLSRMDDGAAYRGYDLILDSSRPAAHFVHRWPDNAFKVVAEKPLRLNEWQHLLLCYDGSRRSAGVTLYVDGVTQKLTATTDNPLTGTLRTDKPFHIGRRQNSAPFRGAIDDLRVFSVALREADAKRLASGAPATGLRELLATPSDKRTPEQQQLIRSYFLDFADPLSKSLRTELAEIPGKRSEIENQIPVTMVMQELPQRRPSFILKRGQYDQPGPQVRAAIPAVFSRSLAANPADAPEPTRLDLARWLTDPKHPLTSRVAVNRLWEMLFGTGIVETSADFGIQGSPPSHPELLDWLAVELIESGWNQRALLKAMLLSRTYAQSSTVTPRLREVDPRNSLLARAPRLRLPAELIRDNLLAASGLLSTTVGGPSVRPWQPAGLWEDVSVERREKYVTDTGENARRRSLYSFWKRTCPPPGMTTFDAPDRETCVIRRSRTNTPLQALVLLNDPTYLAASQHLARQLLQLPADADRWTSAFQRVLCRTPAVAETEALNAVLKSAREHFRTHPGAADELINSAQIATPPAHADTTAPGPATNQQDAIEIAAWSTAISTLMNTDEAITRP